MQFSENWLRSLCNPALDTEQLCRVLTMAGLEVEECRPASADFAQVVVGHILSAEKHPDAEKLKVCRVDVGQGEPLQIVCGAPNAAAGMKVPCALVGATLPGFEIKKAKLRGVESFGMLCSARELGLSDDHGGLLPLAADARVGANVREVLDLNDHLITLKLTPNRADCLSLLGIARELSALTGAELKAPAIAPVAAVIADTREIHLDAADACPRYCGRIVRGVNAQAPTPEWMKRRIERSGVRPISALVDITNYVMLELGQPLHAFDDAQLSGAIHVRYPRAGETLTLLNEQAVTPSDRTALIADDAKALALAGIMGGEHSGIADTTRDLFLESAFFQPDAIAGKARALGFSSDASHRYERGVDFDLPARAIERATELIQAICGGQPGPVVEAVKADALPQRPSVALRPARANRALGLDLSTETMAAMLRRLGLAVTEANGVLHVTPPAARFDIAIEEDLIEELARLHGYDNIPSLPPRANLNMLAQIETQRTPMQLRHRIADLGYFETVNFSFVDAGLETTSARTSNPFASPIRLPARWA
jgi:phenylalanyl-tRNA synthetase beta chain